ncbi:MAG: sensor domain-containing diguanylate cyclase, partial [Myxococcota bacterium]
ATEELKALQGRSFELGSSLLALTLKHRCALPQKGYLRSTGPFLAKEDPQLPPFESLYLIPLILHDQAVGLIGIGSKNKEAFASSEVEKNLGALANQVSPLLSHLQHFARLEYLAARDGLTGLFNHRTLMERAQTSLKAAHRFKRPLSVIMMDIDHFKKLNDRYGHPTGDQVLHQVAKVLQDSTREIDIAARYGGEEFAVLLEETDAKGALQLADRLRAAIASLHFCAEHVDDELFSITVSIGVASFPQHAEQLSTLFKTADEALYLAKHKGRNRVQLYTPHRLDALPLQHASEIPPTAHAQNLEELPQTNHSGWGWGSLPPQETNESISDLDRWSWSASRDALPSPELNTPPPEQTQHENPQPPIHRTPSPENLDKT